MTPYAVLAELTVDMNLLLPVAAGVVAGLSVVGTIHYLIRPRLAAPLPPAPPQEQEVADPWVHGSSSEQRRAFRRQGNPIEVLIVDQPRNGLQFKGYVINRSIGGLCLQVDRPYETEIKISVRPVNAPHIAPWVDLTIKSCRESNPGYEIGCQFTQTPPWAILLMFG
jgi:hypothetical protein